jgi:hypothetical protein
LVASGVSRFERRFSRAVASGIVHRIVVIEHEKKLFPSIQFLRNLSTCAASGVHPRERVCGRARAYRCMEFIDFVGLGDGGRACVLECCSSFL